MAIDADLNAGLMTREEARERRNEVREEADFYGSMDGASKFIRGDALAGIMILVINVIGGLIIGTMQHGMGLGDALKRSEEHTSELQSLMRISYAVFCLKKKNKQKKKKNY